MVASQCFLSECDASIREIPGSHFTERSDSLPFCGNFEVVWDLGSRIGVLLSVCFFDIDRCCGISAPYSAPWHLRAPKSRYSPHAYRCGKSFDSRRAIKLDPNDQCNYGIGTLEARHPHCLASGTFGLRGECQDLGFFRADSQIEGSFCIY